MLRAVIFCFYLSALIFAPLLTCAADTRVEVVPFPYKPLGYVQLTSLATAVALSPPGGATVAFVVCTGQPVNWRDDGIAPTASVGMFLPTSQEIMFSEKPLTVVQIIQTASASVCNVTYASG